MANELQKMLVKLGLATADWDTVVSRVRKELNSINQTSKRAHEERLAQSTKEVAKEKEKATALTENVKHINAQLTGYKSVIAQQTLSNEKQLQLVQTSKNLLAEQQHYLSILKLMPGAHDLDIQRMEKKLKINREEFALEEQRIKVAMGKSTARPAPGQAPPESVTSGKMSRLETSLSSAQLRTSIQTASAEAAANTNAYKSGEIALKEYVEKQKAILEEAHSARLNLIEVEQNAQLKQVADLTALGKKTKEEADLEVKIINEKNKAIADSETHRYQAQVAALSKAGAPATASPTRTATLQRQLGGVEAKSRLAEINEEQGELDRQRQEKKVKEEEYVQKSIRLNSEAHSIRMGEIESERKAKLTQLEAEVRANKISTDEEKIRTKIIHAETDARIADEKRFFESKIRSAKAQPEKEGIGEKLGGAAAMILTGGLGPQMMAAVAAGNVLEKVLEHIADKLKEIFVGGGREQQLSEQFKKLTARGGDDPVEYMESLRKSTKGLVTDFQLFRVANNFMQSGVKASGAQISELIKYTTGLTRAQGENVQVGMQQLIRASITGRTSMLGFALGIDRQTLALQGVPQSMDPAVRKTLEFAHTLDVLKKRYQEIGEPALTFQEVMQQASVATVNMFGAAAQSMAEAKPFQDFIKVLGFGVGTFSELAEKAGKIIGEVLGQAFVLINPLLDLQKASWEALIASMSAVWEIVRLLGQALGWLMNEVFGKEWGGVINSAIGNLFSFHGVLGTTAQVVVLTAATFKGLALMIKLVAAELKALADHSVKEAVDALNDFDKEREKLAEETYNKLAQAEQYKQGKGTTVPLPAPAGPRQQNEQSIQEHLKLAKLDLQISKETDKARFDSLRGELQDEKEALQERYDDGLMSLQQYTAAEKEIRTRQHNARLAEIEADRRASIKELKDEQDARLGTLRLQQEDALKEGDKGKERAVELEKDYNNASTEYGKRTRLINLKSQSQVTAENMAYRREEFQFDRKLDQDGISARRKYMSEILSIEKIGVEQRKSVIEKEFQDGEMSAEEYVNQRKQLVQEEFENARQAAMDTYAASVKDKQSEAALNIAFQQAEVQRQKELTDIITHEDDTRLQAIEHSYSTAKGLLQSMLQLSQTPFVGTSLAGGSQQEFIGALQAINNTHLKQLQTELADLDTSSGEFSHNWVKIKTGIIEATQEHVKLNQQMLEANDHLTPIAKLFGTLSGPLGQFSNVLGQSLQKTSDQLQAIAKYRQEAVGANQTGNPFKDVATSFKGMFSHTQNRSQSTAQTIHTLGQSVSDAVGKISAFGSGITAAATKVNGVYQVAGTHVSTFTNAVSRATAALLGLADKAHPPQPGEEVAPDVVGVVGEQGKSDMSKLGNILFGDLGAASKKAAKQVATTGETFNDKLGKFTSSLGQAVGGVSNFIGAITGAKTGGAGALGGGMAGMSMGAQAGPMGALIGGLGGALMGGLTGMKNERLQDKIDLVNVQLTAIQRSVSEGSTGMGDAIQQVTALRSSAISTFSQAGKKDSGKKGQKKGFSSQMQSTMTALNTELGQLIAQQKKLMDDMHEQIDLLSNPAPFQQYVSGLQDIINKYQEFSKAAQGNATEVAQAQQYLTLALQNYYVQMQQQGLQDQESAIQNAIQLNDLLQQRNDMERQYEESLFNIMNAGVKVRTFSDAQTKASQIADLQRQHAIQEQNMNEQIAVAQNRVDQEKTIFNLASTRVGLESQLLAVQEQQTGFDMQRIAALQQVIQKLSTADFSNLGNLQNLFAQLGLATPINLTGYGMPDTTIPRYAPTNYNGWTFVKQIGGWDLYTRNGSYKVVGPDGKMYDPGLVGITGYALGGGYPANEPRIVGEAGPELDIPSRSGTILTNKVITEIARVTSPSPVDKSGNVLGTHREIYTLATQRASIEMAVVQAQNDYVDKDMQRITLLRGLLSDVHSVGGGVGTGDIEALMSQLYGIRGRYGAGGFNKESL